MGDCILTPEEREHVAAHLTAMAQQKCPYCDSSDLRESTFTRPDGDRTVYCGACKARVYQGRLLHV